MQRELVLGSLDVLLILCMMLGLIAPLVIFLLARFHQRSLLSRLLSSKVIGISCLLVGVPLVVFGGMVLLKLQPYDEACYFYLVSGSILVVIGICALSPKTERVLRPWTVRIFGGGARRSNDEGIIVFGASPAVKFIFILYEALFVLVFVVGGIMFSMLDVILFAFCVVPVFLWPPTVTMDEQGLSSAYRLWGRKQWMPWSDVRELIVDAAKTSVTVVSVRAHRVTHTALNADQAYFILACLRRVSPYGQASLIIRTRTPPQNS